MDDVVDHGVCFGRIAAIVPVKNMAKCGQVCELEALTSIWAPSQSL